MAQRKETIVMFPFMAQGHIIPYLALALEIEQKFGYSVIFINTPLNIKKLEPTLPPNSSIHLLSLPFSSLDHNLPPNSENTDVLPYELILNLLQSSLSLKPSFNSLISNLINQDQIHPLCIISDMFFGWVSEIAKRFGIFHSTFLSGGAYGMGVYYSMWINQPQIKTDLDEFLLPDFPKLTKIHRSQLARNLSEATCTDPWSIFNVQELPLSLKADGFLINTVEDLESTGLDYFRKKTGNPVWAIGPVNYSLTNKARINEVQEQTGISSDFCIKWLDNHKKDSVLFVSFGSQNTISSSQLMELAIGLEKSERNFIWVIRPPLGFDINGEFKEEWLPKGFEERMKEKNRGLLVRKWAPQLEILGHESTSVFLSHCGWNSTLESLSFGVPIIGWPIAADQFYNVKFLEEEVGVCVEIARGNRCEIKHEDVVRLIDLVMSDGSKKGEEMREKASKIREMIKNAITSNGDEGCKGSSIKALEDFFEMALSTRKKKREEK